MAPAWQTKSKTRKKKEAHAAQAVGVRLTRLSDDQLARAGLPKELVEAVRFAKTLKKRGALRRQFQYIGTLMRNEDPDRIEAAIERASAPGGADRRLHRRVEDCRDRLAAGDPALEERLRGRLSDEEWRGLEPLIRQAGEASEASRGKAGRHLFRQLRTLAECLFEDDPVPPPDAVRGASSAPLPEKDPSQEAAHADDEAAAESRAI